MVRRWRLGMGGLVALMGLGLQACIAVPVDSRPVHSARPTYGYGGSGVYSNVDAGDARRECVQEARGYRSYRGVRAGAVEIVGPDTARVELRARLPYGGYRSFACMYNARTGNAYLP